MTTFISHTATVRGHSFVPSFAFPGLVTSGEPFHIYSLTQSISPEHVAFQLLDQYPNPKGLSSQTSIVEYTGHSLVAVMTSLFMGHVDHFSTSRVTNESFTGVTFLKQDGYSIYGLNLDVADIPANFDQSQGIWKLITRGDDFFDATLPTALEQSPYREEPPYWAQHIEAGPGNDTILASPERDYLIGGTGGNAIRAGAGDDVFYAGDTSVQAWQDIWSVAYGEAGNDHVWAGWGSNAFLDGGSGDDILADGAGTDVLVGGSGNDTLLATSGTNYVMILAQDVMAGEMDTIHGFTAATNYLQLPAAWAGAVGTYFDGASTFLALPAGSGTFYVQISNAAPADVWSHLYYA